jgi:2-oxoisovalerate dehydrogenase E1 component beta subunit
VSHEAPLTAGFASEVAATIQERCFLRLEAPVQRVCGWDTPFSLAMEKLMLPNEARCFEAIKEAAEF